MLSKDIRKILLNVLNFNEIKREIKNMSIKLTFIKILFFKTFGGGITFLDVKISSEFLLTVVCITSGRFTPVELVLVSGTVWRIDRFTLHVFIEEGATVTFYRKLEELL